MLMINGKEWFAPLANSGWDLKSLYGGVTENEVNLGGINWEWFHYPTLEEALQGLKVRDPEAYNEEMKRLSGEYFVYHRVTEEFRTKKKLLWKISNLVESEPNQYGFSPCQKEIEFRYSESYKIFFLTYYRQEKVTSLGTISHYEVDERNPVENWGYRLHK